MKYKWECPTCGAKYMTHKDIPPLCRVHSPPHVTIQHDTDSEDCWCKPEILYIDDAILVVHNKVPLIDGPDTEDIVL